MNLKLVTLSLTHKLILTLFLALMGLSYLFVLLNIQLNTGAADGEPGTTVQDIIVTYRGNPNVTLLETMIHTKMREYLPSEETALDIEQWIADGKTEGGYKDIRWIFDENCVRCHSADGEASQRLLTTYEEVSATAVPQLRSIGSLVSFSHYHVFGMALFTLAMTLIFSFSSFGRTVRIVVCCLPFVAILSDILSWWLMRFVSPVFAYLTLIAGGLLGISFALLILGSLYDLWLRRTP